ncbi:MAG: hypothetical protein JST30_03845 [Armatimonadetes bacterium]|nr:hypothetical protein [Armatimonadota bacterium]
MEDLVAQVAAKLGIDPAQASDVLAKLQSGGHDVPAMLQNGDLAEKVQGLFGGDLQGMLGNIPGVGDLLGQFAPQETGSTD